MSKLPVVSGLQCVKALTKAGFSVRRQKGSHIVMQRADPYAMVVVPDHKELRPGTLKGIIRDAGLTVEQFITLLNS